MPLKLFDTADAIPEPLRATALETKDGKFAVVEEEDVSGLKSALEKERKAAKDAAKLASEREREMAAIKAEADAKAAGLTGEKLAEIRAQAEAKFKADLDERDRLKAENRALRLDTQAKALLNGQVPDVEAAWKLLGGDYDLTDDGKVIVKGDPTADVKQHLLSAQKEKYPWLFLGSQASGGAGSGGRGGAATPGAKPPTQWTGAERAAFISEKGADAYHELLQQEATTRLTAPKKAA